MIHLTEKSHQTIFQDRILCFFRRVHPRAFMKRYVGICDSDLCHILSEDFPKATPEPPQSGDLPSVIEYFKIVKQYAHFISFKIPFLLTEYAGIPSSARTAEKSSAHPSHFLSKSQYLYTAPDDIPCFYPTQPRRASNF